MTVEVVGYVQGVAPRIAFPVRISDVVATLRGSVDPERYYVVSGHYDSRVGLLILLLKKIEVWNVRG